MDEIEFLVDLEGGPLAPVVVVGDRGDNGGSELRIAKVEA